MSTSAYKKELHALRVELVKLQNEVIARRLRIVVVFEGRDAAGKDGVIKRIIKHLSPRETRVVALGKPSNADEAQLVLPAFRAASADGGGAGAIQPELVQPRRGRTRDGLLYPR